MYGVQFKLSIILHPAAEKGRFANQFFSKDETIVYYQDTLIYNITVDPLQRPTHYIFGEGVMSVTVKGFFYLGVLEGEHCDQFRRPGS